MDRDHVPYGSRQSWRESKVRQLSEAELEQVIHPFSISRDSSANWTHNRVHLTGTLKD